MDVEAGIMKAESREHHCKRSERANLHFTDGETSATTTGNNTAYNRKSRFAKQIV